MRRNIQPLPEEKLARSEKCLHRALILFIVIVLLFLFILAEFVPDTVL